MHCDPRHDGGLSGAWPGLYLPHGKSYFKLPGAMLSRVGCRGEGQGQSSVNGRRPTGPALTPSICSHIDLRHFLRLLR